MKRFPTNIKPISHHKSPQTPIFEKSDQNKIFKAFNSFENKFEPIGKKISDVVEKF